MAIERKYGKVTTERGAIPDNEPVVVFRGQDALAPVVMRMYAMLCGSHGLSEMAQQAEKTALELEAWGKKKLPDW